MQGVKTYIVEDSPIILDHLVATLQEMTSVRVVGSAADERAALQWLLTPGNDCDLIVIDIFLKSGSGLHVLEAATKAGLPGKRVVLTNYASADMRRQCRELGAHRVFDKSSEVEELVAYCQQLAAGEIDAPDSQAAEQTLAAQANSRQTPAPTPATAPSRSMATLRAALSQFQRSVVAVPLAALVALLLLGVSELSYRSASNSLGELDRGESVRQRLQSVQRGLIDAETGQRGYLLTGRAEYLAPYEAGMRSVRDTIASLTTKFQGDASVVPIMAELAQRSEERLSELETTIALYDAGKRDSWQELVSSNIGKERMDAVRKTALRLVEIETARIDRERSQVANTLRLSRLGIGALTLVSVLAFFMYMRQSTAVEAVRARLAVEVAAERDRLEAEVTRRTAELTELTRHLQTAREDERHHLARELHDELGAILTAAKLDAARLKRNLGTTTPALAERLTKLGELLDSGIALKRRIIEDLRPSSLSNLGLVAALRIQANEFAKRSDAQVTVDLQPVELPESAQIAVFRLVQESFTNVAKYAAASRVKLRMEHRGANVVVSVVDNGKGFDMARTAKSTHGLIGMRFRVEAHGGQLRVQSSPGQGTRIEATLPLSAGAA